MNHAVEFRGFQDAHGDAVDVADAIVAHLLDAASRDGAGPEPPTAAGATAGARRGEAT
ncbi:hypothetical protein [Actinomadura sp. CNU-125]|uniref:hypothetical protein n=1 Tax=Actinomadura sp. CNU-125 TaxID=1904961 RepID=UPI000B0347CF|nr:hypothetical protein [Actinomadura sp. CNU-125]